MGEESFRRTCLSSSPSSRPVTAVTIVVYTDQSIRISRSSLPWLAESGPKLVTVTNPSLTPTIDFDSGRCTEVSLITVDRHFDSETRTRSKGSVKRILEIARGVNPDFLRLSVRSRWTNFPEWTTIIAGNNDSLSHPTW